MEGKGDVIAEGSIDGGILKEGCLDGVLVGCGEGSMEGCSEGDPLGLDEGCVVGASLGDGDGPEEGRLLGESVRMPSFTLSTLSTNSRSAIESAVALSTSKS